MRAKELITHMFEAIDANAFEELERYLDTSIVYERPGYATLAGMGQLLHFYQCVRCIRSGRHRLHGVMCDGTQAMTHGRFEGMLKSGDPVEIEFSETYRLNPQGTKIAFRKTYFFQPAI